MGDGRETVCDADAVYSVKQSWRWTLTTFPPLFWSDLSESDRTPCRTLSDHAGEVQTNCQTRDKEERE